MKPSSKTWFITAAVMVVMAAPAMGQYYTTYYQPVTTYYQPATVYYPPAPTTYVAAPTTVYYTSPTTTYYAAAPTTVYYSPAPTVTYYRPLVGSRITRVGYYTPAVVYPPSTTYQAYYPWW
jgi:hypothetical protein